LKRIDRLSRGQLEIIFRDSSSCPSLEDDDFGNFEELFLAVHVLIASQYFGGEKSILGHAFWNGHSKPSQHEGQNAAMCG
jgi:hypothetical protein